MNNNFPHKTASYKVIADHLRSSAFLIADGVLPSNEGRGYVLRRIMRRAMLHCHKLNEKEIFFYKLVPSLIANMGEGFFELKTAQSLIIDTLKIEEERFRKTIGKGMELLDEELKNIQDNQFSGIAAFKLYDTYGFPLDLTQNILKEKNIEVNLAEFDEEMKKQKQRAKENWSGSGDKQDDAIYFDLKEKFDKTEFLGYKTKESEATILALIADGKVVDEIDENSTNAAIILDKTPFYATSGGQRGDSGWINSTQIKETKKMANAFHVHFVSYEQENSKNKLKVGDKIIAHVDSLRSGKEKAHSATHLLHYVLKQNLGNQITQKGSDVASNSFTFDFNHNQPLTKEELMKIEDDVNQLIFDNSKVLDDEMPIKEAKEKGAVALFGEKYDDVVRVLTMGKNSESIELCGGTHVKNTGEIGLFKIMSEKGIAAGIRRITAKTDQVAIDDMQEVLKSLNTDCLESFNKLEEKCQKNNIKSDIIIEPLTPDLNSRNNEEKIKEFRNKKERLETKKEELFEALKQVDKKIQKLKSEKLNDSDFKSEKIGEVNFIYHIFEDLNAKDLRDLIIQVKSKKENEANTVILFFAVDEIKIAVALAISNDLTNQFNAGKLIPEITQEIGGKGGGGKPDLAFGGGSDKSRIEEAVEVIKRTLLSS